MSARRGRENKSDRQSKHNLGLVLAGNEVHSDVTRLSPPCTDTLSKRQGSCGKTDAVRLLDRCWKNNVLQTSWCRWRKGEEAANGESQTQICFID